MGEYTPGRLLAKLKPNVTISDIRTIIPSATVAGVIRGITIIDFIDAEVIDEVNALTTSGLVEYAHPDNIYKLHTPTPYNPNDPYYASGDQWALWNEGQNGGVAGADIRAPLAWRLLYEAGYSIGRASLSVAVIDTGVDYSHPDLSDNCKKADGFDFFNNDSDPMDDGDHGTHVAGIIGAKGNNGIGVSGVAWNCRIHALKAFNASMQGSDTSILYAIDYVSVYNIPIVNMSFGSSSFSQALHDAIAELTDTIFICAAGNDGINVDTTPVYPACFDCSNIISVCNTNNKDELNQSSNYGSVSVDVAAPGSNICSTIAGGTYVWLSGTSMAAPMVTGVIVLLKSAFPSMTVAQLKAAIISSVDVKSNLSTACNTSGRINAYKAFSGLIADPTVTTSIRRQSAIRDVDNDDKYYARRNGSWVEVPGLGYTAGSGIGITDNVISVTLLGEDNKIISSYLPSSIIGAVSFNGTFDPSTGTAPLPAEQGLYYIAIAAGTVDGVSFEIGDWLVYRSLTAWDKIGNSSASVLWNNIINKPTTFPPILGETSDVAYRGDRGLIAYTHAMTPHAPADAQKNSDITQEEILAKITGIYQPTNGYLTGISNISSTPNSYGFPMRKEDGTWIFQLGVSSSTPWGSITGNINSQLDLIAILNTLVPESRTINGSPLSSDIVLPIPDELADLSSDSTHRLVTDDQITTWNAKQAALGYTAENIANKGAAGGYVPLGSNGKISSEYIGTIALTSVIPSETEPASPSDGMVWVNTTTGVNKIYSATTSTWYELGNPSSYITSINGHTGPTVTLVKSDIGLGNVPNVDTSNAANISSGILDPARLPKATSSTIGGVKAGTNITIDADGTINASMSSGLTWGLITGSINDQSDLIDLLNAKADITHDHTGTYQPLDLDLSSIAAITDLTGILRKSAENTWYLDQSSYITTSDLTTALAGKADIVHTHDYQPISGALSAISAFSAESTGYLRKTGPDTYELDNNIGSGGSGGEFIQFGTATVTAGTKSVEVTHNYGEAPSIIQVVPNCNITNVTTTTFTINMLYAQSADVVFNWSIPAVTDTVINGGTFT